MLLLSIQIQSDDVMYHAYRLFPRINATCNSQGGIEKLVMFAIMATTERNLILVMKEVLFESPSRMK
jgi:hypothetical protein